MNELTSQTFPDDLRPVLSDAKRILEHHGIADRLTELVGVPITSSIKMLPSGVEKAIYGAIDQSLRVALDVALRTLGNEKAGGGKPRFMTHKVLAGLTGAAGGAFGGAAIAAELPVSTVLILRSVADIARSEGEDLGEVEARLACLEVFALDPGKESAVDDDTEFGYFAVRAAMAKQIRDASQHVLKHGTSKTSAPPLVQLVRKIGERFGVVVSEKLAAQAIPVIGAVGGALINSYFIDHYQDLARAHFTIRRFEREYGAEAVRKAFDDVDA